MPDFWPSCGYRLLAAGADGRLTLTDDFLRSYLARPELAPVRESCAAELALAVPRPVTLAAVLGALEAGQPRLAGAVRDRVTGGRRPLVRFYACQNDLSNLAPDAALPDDVAKGREPLLIVGAIAGG